MGGIDSSFFEVGRLDRLARRNTAVHRLDSRAKLITAAVFLVCVVSFGKYEVAALLPYAVFPVTLAAVGHIPFGYLGRRILALAPFALLVGLFNPWLDRQILLQLGPIGVSGGWLSLASIFVRFALSIGTVLVLIGVTSFDGLCMGLQRLMVPRVFIVQLLFLYRYVFVLADEAARLARARALRSFGSHGLGWRIYGNLIGHLLIRTLDRARRIHMAMNCRGFTGEIHQLRNLRIGRPEVFFAAGWCSLFIIFRSLNLPRLLGELVAGMTG